MPGRSHWMLHPGLRRSHLLGVPQVSRSCAAASSLTCFIHVRAAGCESALTNTVTCSLKWSLVTGEGSSPSPFIIGIPEQKKTWLKAAAPSHSARGWRGVTSRLDLCVCSLVTVSSSTTGTCTKQLIYQKAPPPASHVSVSVVTQEVLPCDYLRSAWPAPPAAMLLTVVGSQLLELQSSSREALGCVQVLLVETVC